MQTYHNKTVQQTAELLGTDIKTGLTHDEVKTVSYTHLTLPTT